jgi:hypothetical protein
MTFFVEDTQMFTWQCPIFFILDFFTSSKKDGEHFQCNRKTRRALRFPRSLLIVDSTSITFGQTRLPWVAYHEKCSGVKLHVAYSPALGMPMNVIETILAFDTMDLSEKNWPTNERYTYFNKTTYYQRITVLFRLKPN